MPRTKKISEIERPPAAAESFDSQEPGERNTQFRRSPKDFFTMAAERDPSGLILYVYRVWPVVNRAKSGSKEKYVDKVVPPDITEEYIRQSHGRGQYKLILHDSLSGKYGQSVGTTYLEITDPDLEPKLNLAELDAEHPSNKTYVMQLRREGKLPPEESEAMNNGNQAAALQQLTATVTTLAGKLAEKNPQAADGITQALGLVEKFNAQKPDPIAMAKQVKELLGGGDQNGQLLALLFQQNNMLMERVLTQAAGPASSEDDWLEKAEKLLGVASKLGLRAGGHGGGSWVSELVAALPSVASAIVQASMLQSAARAGAPGQVQAAGVPPPPAPAPGAHSAGAVPPPAPALAGAPDAAALPPELAQFEGVFQMMGLSALRVFDVTKQALAAFRRGVAGDDWAHALVNMTDDGERLYDLLAQFGKDQILAVLRTSPAWVELAAREADVLAWLDAFLEYGRPDEGQEGGGQ